MTRLYGPRWGCPVCGRVLTRPPTRVRADDERHTAGRVPVGLYHSYHCRKPMVPVTVTPTEEARARTFADYAAERAQATLAAERERHAALVLDRHEATT